MSGMIESGFLTPKELAARLKIATFTVQRWAREGRYTAQHGFVRVGGRLRIHWETFAEVLAASNP